MARSKIVYTFFVGIVRGSAFCCFLSKRFMCHCCTQTPSVCVHLEYQGVLSNWIVLCTLPAGVWARTQDLIWRIIWGTVQYASSFEILSPPRRQVGSDSHNGEILLSFVQHTDYASATHTSEPTTSGSGVRKVLTSKQTQVSCSTMPHSSAAKLLNKHSTPTRSAAQGSVGITWHAAPSIADVFIHLPGVWWENLSLFH